MPITGSACRGTRGCCGPVAACDFRPPRSHGNGGLVFLKSVPGGGGGVIAILLALSVKSSLVVALLGCAQFSVCKEVQVGNL